jgi:hypothetical protein
LANLKNSLTTNDFLTLITLSNSKVKLKLLLPYVKNNEKLKQTLNDKLKSAHGSEPTLRTNKSREKRNPEMSGAHWAAILSTK